MRLSSVHTFCLCITLKSCATYDHAALTVHAGCASPVQSIEKLENTADKHALYTCCCVTCVSYSRFICMSSALVFSVVILSTTQDFSSLGV